VSAKAVVIGGGIGGLTAATALGRAGLDVVVFERRDDLRKINAGAGIVLWHNAVRALRTVGLAERLDPISTPLEHAEWQTWRGRPLARWEVGETGRMLVRRPSASAAPTSIGRLPSPSARLSASGWSASTVTIVPTASRLASPTAMSRGETC
jgi:2-polyprenyl-6-methoxyphenol hydroxylase-like FAD-dependent oxidoreductase